MATGQGIRLVRAGRFFLLLLPLPILWALTSPNPPFAIYGPLRLSIPGIVDGNLLFVRFSLMALATILAASTVAPGEWMRLLVRFPLAAVLFAGSARFAPVAVAELRRIDRAQELRGARPGRRRLRPAVVPAFVLSARRARTVGQALRSAGYEGEAAFAGRIVAFTALAIAGRLLFLWVPNVALTYLVVFVAGVAYGSRVGASVGLLSMAIVDVGFAASFTGVIVNAVPMAVLGAFAGLLRFLDLGQRVGRSILVATTVAAVLGAGFTILFSVLSDTLSYAVALSTGVAANPSAYYLLVAAGVLFNVPAAAANAGIFAALAYPVLSTLRRAGLVAAETGRKGIRREARYPVKPA